MISTQEVPTPDRAQARKGSHIKFIGVDALVLLSLVAIGAVPRVMGHREALAATMEAPVTHPVISVIHAIRGEPTSQLVLPASPAHSRCQRQRLLKTRWRMYATAT
jgi:hypothetical protein